MISLAVQVIRLVYERLCTPFLSLLYNNLAPSIVTNHIAHKFTVLIFHHSISHAPALMSAICFNVWSIDFASLMLVDFQFYSFSHILKRQSMQ
ncbi:hypothetical protein CW304_05200 [Bacillus sp. UFRGS-B20]|nr:hypothetical protein CW304_05200 [Bacillus sp. UFRGS-B20]